MAQLAAPWLALHWGISDEKVVDRRNYVGAMKGKESNGKGREAKERGRGGNGRKRKGKGRKVGGEGRKKKEREG